MPTSASSTPIPLSLTYKTGVTTTRGSERTKEGGPSDTAYVEVSVEYGSVSGVGLSTEQSKTVISERGIFHRGARELGHLLTRPGMGEVALWAWQVSGQESSLSSVGRARATSSPRVQKPAGRPPCSRPRAFRVGGARRASIATRRPLIPGRIACADKAPLPSRRDTPTRRTTYQCFSRVPQAGRP